MQEEKLGPCLHLSILPSVCEAANDIINAYTLINVLLHCNTTTTTVKTSHLTVMITLPTTKPHLRPITIAISFRDLAKVESLTHFIKRWLLWVSVEPFLFTTGYVIQSMWLGQHVDTNPKRGNIIMILLYKHYFANLYCTVGLSQLAEAISA